MLKPNATTQVPTETVRVAKAAFPKGNVYLRIRDELGSIFQDEDLPHLITHVMTTTASSVDFDRTLDVHVALARKGLLPSEHLLDGLCQGCLFGGERKRRD
ncbi:MAG: hypothetical protein ACRCYY_18665 [Trueperaceae bacterium]